MKTKGHTLVGLLAAMAIVAILAAGMYTGGFGLLGTHKERPDGEGRTIIGRSVARAKDHQCAEYLKQVRMAIGMAQIDEYMPEKIEELPGITRKLTKCPIGSEPYQYDPVSATVTCPHPGHEHY